MALYQRCNENAINRLVDFIEKNRYSGSVSTIIERVNARQDQH
jgi:hypothetical protein